MLLLAAWSCDEDTIGLEIKGDVKGTVLDDESGEPLDSVRVTTSPATTTVFTDENGEFLLEDILVDDYSVKAELETYVTGFKAITVTEDKLTEVFFDLKKSEKENKAPSAPILGSPEDGATGLGLEVEFTWSASDPDEDELTYTLELRSGADEELRSFEVVNDTSLVVGDLQLATKYLWQVTVSDGTYDSITSMVREFTTLSSPDFPFILVKQQEGNNVIYSGQLDADNEPILYQLTDENKNSFRPRVNREVRKIAYLQNVGAETHLFTMDLDGTDKQQVSAAIPVAGFRETELDFTWAQNGGKLYYPNFDKLYSIEPDGGSIQQIYQTTDGSLITEVAVAELDQDVLLIKTNNLQGYNVRIYTYRLSTGLEENVILQGMPGAAGSVDISANGDEVLYSYDTSGSENSQYRQFDTRLFIYNVASMTAAQLETDAVSGDIETDASFSPDEGAVIFVRSKNNTGAEKNIYSRLLSDTQDDTLLFPDAFMPDWE